MAIGSYIAKGSLVRDNRIVEDNKKITRNRRVSGNRKLEVKESQTARGLSAALILSDGKRMVSSDVQ